jgi:hypothetical protein
MGLPLEGTGAKPLTQHHVQKQVYHDFWTISIQIKGILLYYDSYK